MNKHLLRDIIRAFRTHRYEKTESGMMVLKSDLAIGGSMTNLFVGGPSFLERGADPITVHNLVVKEGRIYAIVVALCNGTKIASWYVAPYKSNSTPQDGWKASSIGTDVQEFTNYDESTRPALIFPAEDDVTDATVVNDATAITTVGSGADKTLWGGIVISNSAKGTATGKEWGAVQFGAARSGLQTGDKLAWLYSLAATNPA